MPEYDGGEAELPDTLFKNLPPPEPIECLVRVYVISVSIQSNSSFLNLRRGLLKIVLHSLKLTKLTVIQGAGEGLFNMDLAGIVCVAMICLGYWFFFWFWFLRCPSFFVRDKYCTLSTVLPNNR